jgi:uncharacterized repeat protein (TIGR01451 family)
MKTTRIKLLSILFSILINIGSSSAQLNSIWDKYSGPGSGGGFAAMHVDNNSNVLELLAIPLNANSFWDYDPGVGVLHPDPATNALIIKLDQNGESIWIKQLSIPGSAVSKEYSSFDSNNNLYILGSFISAFDADPSSNVFTLTPTGGNDKFIIKYDANGDFVWAKSFVMSPNDLLESIKTDSQGNFYLGGTYNGSFDADFNAGINNMPTVNFKNMFIIKYNANGDVQWLYNNGCDNVNNADKLLAFNIDSNDEIVFAFLTNNYYDFDPISSTIDSLAFYNGLNSSSTIASGIALVKLNGNGNIVWINPLPTSELPYFYNPIITFDSNNNFVFACAPLSSFSIIWASNAAQAPVYSTEYGFIFGKFLANGSNLFFKQTNINEELSLIDLEMDSVGNIYIIGSLVSGYSLDLDFGLGSTGHNNNSPGMSRYFFSAYNQNGDYIWDMYHEFNPVESSSLDCKNIYIDKNANTFYLQGSCVNLDFDNYNINSQCILGIGKYSIDPCNTLGILIDSINPAQCTILGTASATAFGGIAPYSFVWNTAPYSSSQSISAPGGDYHLTVQDNAGCIQTRDINIPGPYTSTAFNLVAYANNVNFVAGFNQIIHVSAENLACNSVSGTLNLILDPLLNFNSATPTPSSVNGDTLVWDLNNIDYQSGLFSANVHVTTNSAAQIGDSISYKVLSLPIVGDSDPNNNIKEFTYPVLSSFDPNDKMVFPQGATSLGIIDANTALNYTIRFQNTGNFSATDVVLIDSISNQLVFGSINVLESSHPFTIQYLPNNVIKFGFININLPDSGSDFLGSMGFITFKIDQQPNLPISSTITNKADIYFDFNLPITTNATLNTIGPLITNVSTFDYEEVITYPNPFTDKIYVNSNFIVKEINLYDLTGRFLKKTTKPNGCIDLYDIKSGIYLLEIINENNNTYRKKVSKL